MFCAVLGDIGGCCCQKKAGCNWVYLSFFISNEERMRTSGYSSDFQNLQTVAGVGLGETLAVLDGHKLELGLLVNVQPGVGVVAAIPGDIGTTGKAGNVPG